MAKKNIDWANLGFQYQMTAMRYVSDFKEADRGCECRAE